MMLWVSLWLLVFTVTNAEAVTRYATSTARGASHVVADCQSAVATKCTIMRAITLSLNAGDVIEVEGNTILSPYVYQGANDMINPPANKSGIIVICKNANDAFDGGCTLDGQFQRSPHMFSSGNTHWVIEGFNMKNGGPGNYGVINFYSGSTDNVFRRVVAWDARIDANNNVVGIRADRNLFEDFAAFGTARKIFSNSQGGDDITCRRCWIRFEGSTQGGSAASTFLYKSLRAIWENVLVTWSGELQPETYTDPFGTAFTNFEVTGTAILGVDRLETTTVPKEANSTVRGSIIYTKTTDKIPATAVAVPGTSLNGLIVWGASRITLTDIVRIMSPTHPRFNQHLGISLVRRPHNCPGLSAALSASDGCVVGGVEVPDDPAFVVTNNLANRITSIRGTHPYGGNTGDSYGALNVSGRANEADWSVTNRIGSTTYDYASMHPWQNTENRARVCYQYGTTTPLWPWPMNERIKQATTQAGKYSGPCTIDCKSRVGGVLTSWGTEAAPNMTPRPTRQITDVTAEIQVLLGTIPTTCRSDTVTTFPDTVGYAPLPLTSFP